MRRIIHISDLHFGRDRPELMGALIQAINTEAPDLVALSGDLTQRARPEQYAAARTFIDALKPPVLCVPGNHDVPLYNIALRWLMPWRRWRRWIARELEPCHEDETMVVLGVNTVNPWSWQRGWFDGRDIARVCAACADPGDTRLRIVVAHHPMEHLPGERKKLMRGAEEAIARLSECGVDVILSGHLHTWRAEPFALRVPGNTALQVHAGTGLSTRLRGEVNDFNLLRLHPDRITVVRHTATDAADRFVPAETRRFSRTDAGWAG